MSDTPQLALSDLRTLWRQARAAWYGMSASSVFRGYIREEIARRTIAAQAQRIAQLETALAEVTENIADAYTHGYATANGWTRGDGE